jgi:hypothetical protein
MIEKLMNSWTLCIRKGLAIRSGRESERKNFNLSQNPCEAPLIQLSSSVTLCNDQSTSENSEEKGNSVMNRDDWQKIIPVITIPRK